MLRRFFFYESSEYESWAYYNFCGKKYELPILLAICHGLRTSEILGLKWEDYDGVQLHIQRALVDEGLEDSTKADASDRFVVLCDRAKELIDALKVLH